MEKNEAKTAVKALYLQSAALAGFEVGPNSPEEFVALVEEGFEKVASDRKPEAVANVLKIIAATLELAQETRTNMLGEENVMAGRDKVCPVYPFD